MKERSAPHCGNLGYCHDFLPVGKKTDKNKFANPSLLFPRTAMGRLCLRACLALSCLLVALQPAHGAPPKGTERSHPRTPLRVPDGGLGVAESPSNAALKQLQQQRTRAAPLGVLGLNRRRRRAAHAHPARNIFSPLDSDGSSKGAEMMKRALSLWATLHPLKSSVHEAAQRRHTPTGVAGEAPLRPIGTQPLRWGR